MVQKGEEAGPGSHSDQKAELGLEPDIPSPMLTTARPASLLLLEKPGTPGQITAGRYNSRHSSHIYDIPALA